jgi:hypothetical protein
MRTSSDELAPEAVAAQASAAAMPTATTPPIIPTIPIIRSAVYQHIYRYVPTTTRASGWKSRGCEALEDRVSVLFREWVISQGRPWEFSLFFFFGEFHVGILFLQASGWNYDSR